MQIAPELYNCATARETDRHPSSPHYSCSGRVLTVVVVCALHKINKFCRLPLPVWIWALVKNVSLEPCPWACYLPTSLHPFPPQLTPFLSLSPCLCCGIASKVALFYNWIHMHHWQRQLYNSRNIKLLRRRRAGLRQPLAQLVYCVCTLRHLAAFHLNGFSIAVWTFCINCCNEFIPSPVAVACGKWQVALFGCLVPYPDSAYCLICNCQLAVTADSRIDSLLSLLILIVAFCFWSPTTFDSIELRLVEL